MNKLLAVSVIGTSLIISSNPAKADWDFWSVNYSGDPAVGNRIFTCVSETGVCTQRTTKVFQSNSWTPSESYVDENNNLVIMGGGSQLHSYDLEANTWTDVGNGWTGDYQAWFERQKVKSSSDGSVEIGIGSSIIKVDSDSVSVGDVTLVKKNQDGTIQVGTDANDIDLVGDG